MKKVHYIIIQRYHLMKKQLLFSLIFLFVCLLLFSCEEELTPNESTEKILKTATWKLQSTKIDGVASNLYDGLSVTFTKGAYTTTSGGDIFGSSGTWAFVGTDGKVITLGNGLEVQLDQISSSGITISFFWDKTIVVNGRAGSLKGDHEMVFGK